MAACKTRVSDSIFKGLSLDIDIHHTQMHTSAHTSTYMYEYHMCMYIYIYVHICMHAYVHTHVRTYVRRDILLKYTSQFLLQVTTMPTCVGSSPADLWQKGRPAAQEHFGVLVLL